MIILFFQVGLYAQEETVTNHKGTKVTVRNTVVTTSATAPGDPLQNDIWFDTTSEVTKIYDGAAWLIINVDALAKKEDSANKSSDTNLSDATDTKFPTELAVKTYVDTQLSTSVTDGVDGSNSLILTTDEPIGANCANGGVRVDSGVDDNNNNMLDPSEIDATEYVCGGGNGQNGTNGFNGMNCWDTNENGINDPSEDTNGDGNFNALDCKGDKGDNGPNGPKGDKGDKGDQGPQGNPATDDQTLATTNAPGNISISEGNSISLNVNDNDADASNEIQVLSQSGTGISLSKGGGSANIISSNTGNNISAGTDGGAYFNNPIKACGTMVPSSNTLNAIGIASVVKNGNGRYTFTMNTPRNSANYPIQLTVLETATDDINIYVTAQTTNTFSISMIKEVGGIVPTDSYVDRTFYFTVLDF